MICHIVCESNVLSSPYNGTNKLLAVKLNISTLDRTTFEQNTTLKKKNVNNELNDFSQFKVLDKKLSSEHLPTLIWICKKFIF